MLTGNFFFFSRSAPLFSAQSAATCSISPERTISLSAISAVTPTSPSVNRNKNAFCLHLLSRSLIVRPRGEKANRSKNPFLPSFLLSLCHLDFENFEVVTTSKPGAFPSALRNKRDDVQSEIKDATAAMVFFCFFSFCSRHPPSDRSTHPLM